MINISVLGATGYAGIELVRLLSGHGGVNIRRLVSKSYNGKRLADVYPNFKGVLDITLEEYDEGAVAAESDLVFTALPHGAAKDVIPGLLGKGVRIVDFSADYRYRDKKIYEEWYGSHGSPELLDKSVYGLCELYRDRIKDAALVGNPGCYTTCSILALAPLVSGGYIRNESIIIDAKSGVTGAGRSEALPLSFCECTENMKAYKVAAHRHTSEIEQELSLLVGSGMTVSFTPHLVPLKRGIIATCYADLKQKRTAAELLAAYREFYAGEGFVRIYDEGTLPETKNVAGSNFVDIGIVTDERTGRVIVIGCLDNVMKGAAGQAVQNMNIMYGLDESTGIGNPAFYL